MAGPQSSAPAASDDIVIPFKTERSGVSGRLARMGASIDAILTRHGYPDPVSEALGQALVLVAMLGSTLKPGGRLGLQTKSDGPLSVMVADFEHPGGLRGYASFESARIFTPQSGSARETQGGLFGSGLLALTIDPGGDADSYQGVVPLEGQSLTAAALAYFRRSEQLPTFMRMAVARHFTAADGAPGAWRWRAGGLLVQHAPTRLDPGEPDDAVVVADDADRLAGEDDDPWQRVRVLAATVEDHELLDPTLAPDRLLYRLFHEEGVRVYRARPVADKCRCSRERVSDVLKRFGPAELEGLRESDGGVTVTCEFCSAHYRFEAGELEEVTGR